MGIQLRETDAQLSWFQPPQLRTLADEGERHASWLELFFDLVFVVAITELSQYLVADHSAGGFLRFAALFVPVWVAWQGYMAYATRFDTDDLGFRLAYFGAMLAIAAMAVLIGDVARGVHSAGSRPRPPARVGGSSPRRRRRSASPRSPPSGGFTSTGRRASRCTGARCRSSCTRTRTCRC